MITIIIKQSFDNTINTLKTKYLSLEEGGSAFCFFTTEYDDSGNVKHDFFEIIKEATKIGYDYVNTVVFPTKLRQNVTFSDNVKYIVWLCKDHSKLIFNKDVIREKHIWKDVEWGKRKKNYNPKGKDPGNVWIPTLDDGKANITEHILLTEEEVIARLLNMTLCGDKFEIYEEDVNVKSIESYDLNYHIQQKEILPTVVFKSSEIMDYVAPKSVTTIVTSPPYWNLKDYYKKGQIGQEPYDIYLSRMRKVWEQCYYKLEGNGSLWININIRVRDGKAILIPFDIISMCKKIGFYYKGIVIWHKSSGIPTNNKNIVDRHEYVLIFSKNEKYSMKQTTFSMFNDYKNNEINGGAFWNINRKAGSVGKKFIHPAIYPNELSDRIISVSSEKNSLVLDPFLGSGTSLISALNKDRYFIGYEYNEGFKELMDSRFSSEIKGKDINYIYS